MNKFIVVFGKQSEFTVSRACQASEKFDREFGGFNLVACPIFTRAHLAQAVGELEDAGVDNTVTVLRVDDTALSFKFLADLRLTFPELVAAYHIGNLGKNVLPHCHSLSSRGWSPTHLSIGHVVTEGECRVYPVEAMTEAGDIFAIRPNGTIARPSHFINRFEVTK